MKKEEDLETKKNFDLFQLDLYHTSIEEDRREGKLYLNGEFVSDTVELAMVHYYQIVHKHYDRDIDSLVSYQKNNPKENWFIKEGTYQVNLRKGMTLYAGVSFYKLLKDGIPYLEGAKQGSIEMGLRVFDAKSEVFTQGIFIPDRLVYWNFYEEIIKYEDGYITIH